MIEQFAGYPGLQDAELAQYAERTVSMEDVLGRERIKRSQVLKQADVVALLALLPDDFRTITTANFRYYEPRCAHDSSLSRPLHALVAARLGKTETASIFCARLRPPTLNSTRTVPAAYGSPDWGVCGRR